MRCVNDTVPVPVTVTVRFAATSRATRSNVSVISLMSSISPVKVYRIPVQGVLRAVEQETRYTAVCCSRPSLVV